MLFVMVGVVVGILIANILSVTLGGPPFGNAPEQHVLAAECSKGELTSLAYTALGYIKDRNYPALSRIAHPEFGVVFTPYPTVSLATNKCFQAEQIAAFGADNAVYVWGVYDGSGEPIEMTAANYLAEYVLSRDYQSASIIGVNKIIKSGNALENIMDVFPDVVFVDFHIPGDERDSTEDFNWTSLRLGFEEYEGKLWLTVILNSKWTA